MLERELGHMRETSQPEPESPTRKPFLIPATSPVMEGTDQNLKSQPSFPIRHCRRILPESLQLKREKLRISLPQIVEFSHFSCHIVALVLSIKAATSISDHL